MSRPVPRISRWNRQIAANAGIFIGTADALTQHRPKCRLAERPRRGGRWRHRLTSRSRARQPCCVRDGRGGQQSRQPGDARVSRKRWRSSPLIRICSQTFGSPQKLAYVQDFATARDFKRRPDHTDRQRPRRRDPGAKASSPCRRRADPRYTRLGHFTLNAAGQMVNKSGVTRCWRAGRRSRSTPMTGRSRSPPTARSRRTGPSRATPRWSTASSTWSTSRTAISSKPEEGTLFNTNAAPIAVAQPAIAQRMLEQSNVQPVKGAHHHDLGAAQLRGGAGVSSTARTTACAAPSITSSRAAEGSPSWQSAPSPQPRPAWRPSSSTST